MTTVYRVDTRYRPQLLFAMMNLFATKESHISFEGNLCSTGLFRMDGSSHEEIGVLKRVTLTPRLDFVVLPLTPAWAAEIEKAVDSKIGFDRYKGIVHVQIESEGEIAFAAYDNFHEDCVVVTGSVPTSVLDDLVAARVLRGYSLVTK